MPSCQRIRKCRKDHKIYKVSRTKEGLCRKKVLQHKRRCGISERKSIEWRNAFDSCRTKSIRTKWPMQKWQQSFRDCRQEEKEEVAMLRKQVTAAWKSCGNSLSPWENRIEAFVQRLQREVWEQMPGREEGRRNCGDEQEQGKTSQQLVLLALGGFNEGTPASSMELDLPRVRDSGCTW